MHSPSGAVRPRESCIYISQTPRGCVIIYIYHFPYKNLNATCMHTIHHMHAKCMQASVCIQDNLILTQSMHTHVCKLYVNSCLHATVCNLFFTCECKLYIKSIYTVYIPQYVNNNMHIFCNLLYSIQ